MESRKGNKEMNAIDWERNGLLTPPTSQELDASKSLISPPPEETFMYGGRHSVSGPLEISDVWLIGHPEICIAAVHDVFTRGRESDVHCEQTQEVRCAYCCFKRRRRGALGGAQRCEPNTLHTQPESEKAD
jgi:hypothetical protein